MATECVIAKVVEDNKNVFMRRVVNIEYLMLFWSFQEYRLPPSSSVFSNRHNCNVYYKPAPSVVKLNLISLSKHQMSTCRNGTIIDSNARTPSLELDILHCVRSKIFFEA